MDRSPFQTGSQQAHGRSLLPLPARHQSRLSATVSVDTSSASSNPKSRPPRVAPGTRGPVPTSCEACRKRRAKCIRNKGGQVGEEACTRCIEKGIVCAVSREITRKPKSVTSRVEQEIVKAQLSTARATSLFDLYFDASTVGLELSFIPLVLYDAWELRARFIVHGGQLDRLEEHEQLRCRIIWASAARRWSELKGTPASLSPSSRHLLKTCREIADRSSIWRTPTRENIVTLVLLFFATANGDLVSHEAQYYLSAACQHLRSLYTIAHPPSSALTGGPDWLPLAVGLHDIAHAQEARTPCFISDRDLAILAPVDEPTYLPPPSFPSSHLVEGSSEVVDHRSNITTHAHITRHALCTARLFANHQAELSRNVTVQQDFAVLDAVWNRLDTLGCAMEEAFTLVEATGLEGIGLAVPQTVLGGLWLPPLQTEFAALSYLRDRADEFGNARSEVGQMSGPHWTAAESLHSVAVARCERALCICLRHTRNRDGIYLLAARSGYLFSVARLNDFATALSHAKADNLDLFPFGASEKLASLTFFLKSLQNAQRIYNTTVLADSITSLAALRKRLEAETGHTGESALSLFASISFEDPLVVPDVPSPNFVETAVIVMRGAAT